MRFRAAALVLLAAWTRLAAFADRPEALEQRIGAVLQRLPERAKVAVCVLHAADGSLVYEKNADEPLRPASTMKLLVTAAALDRFGPGFEFRTTVYAAENEVWIVGGGDPGLGDARLAERAGQTPDALLAGWAEALVAAGVTSVSKIVIDDGVFDAEFRHPDWPASQWQRWYAAPVGGVNFNDNCLDARVVVAGRSATLRLTPELPDSFIENKLAVAGRQRASVARDADSDIFRFTGTVVRNDEFGPVSFNRPSVVVGYALRQALLKRGVHVADEVVRRAIAPDALRTARKIAEHATPLTDVIWRANNFSQNLFAECLIKSLAAYEPDGSRTGVPGSWEAGTQRVREILARLGTGADRATLRDGSGLSHENRVTARQLASVLSVMHRHRFAAEYATSLARPGQDGTLRRRFLDEPLRSRVRAKTGTLLGVSALAGYLQAEDGEMLAFAILCDGPESAARVAEDGIVRQLAGVAPSVNDPASDNAGRGRTAPRRGRGARP